MKLKVAVLDQDLEYVNRLVRAFQQKYSDKILLSVFSGEDKLYQSLKKSHMDIILAEQSMKIEFDRIPENSIVGYLSTIADAEEIDGIPVIYKYQRIDLIYNLILDMYAENLSNIKLRRNGTAGEIVLFTSVQGGAGTSTAAAAYAMKKSFDGSRVFYLNLEDFGNSGLYFEGEGVLSFSDVIYSLKSRKSNLVIKMESAVRTDDSGVEFFYPCRNAYDMLELNDHEIGELIEGISQMKEYDEIVIDLSGNITERLLMLMKDYADSIVYVSDGSAAGNWKFERFCEVAGVMEQRNELGILEKTGLLYNRYSSKTSDQLGSAAVPIFGGIHRFEGLTGKALVKEIARTEAFNRI